jgi:hypothetical protein
MSEDMAMTPEPELDEKAYENRRMKILFVCLGIT